MQPTLYQIPQMNYTDILLKSLFLIVFFFFQIFIWKAESIFLTNTIWKKEKKTRLKLMSLK